MQWMRQHTKIILWVVLAAFLATIFLVWGMQESMDRQQTAGNSIAFIDDEPIPLHLFDQQWSQQVTQYRTSLGGAFTEEMAEGLKAPILKNMIRQELVFREARRQKIGVTTEEIVGNIKALPVFRTPDGRFDEQRYQNAVNNPDTPWTQVEEDIRNQIILVKLRLDVTSGVRMTEAELELAWQRIRGAWAVRVAQFSPAQFEGTMKVFDRELQSWYEEHRSEYEKPETVMVRHILIGLKPGASPDQETQAREKIASIRRQVQGSEGFSRLAAEHSEDPGSAGQGGKLGKITRGMMVPEFETAAFSLNKGGISPVVKTQYGFHIIYCDDHSQGSSTSFASVKETIRKTLIKKKALAVAGLLAQQFSERARAGEPWEKIGFQSMRPQTWSGPWRQNSPLGSYGTLPNVSEQVFPILLPGENSDPVEDNGRIYVVQVVKIQPAPFNPGEFKKERNTLSRRLLVQKQNRFFEIWVESLEKKAKIINHLKELTKKSSNS